MSSLAARGIGDEECHVWWARLGVAEDIPSGLLDREERDRIAGFRRAEDRARAALSSALSRTVLARLAGVRPADLVFVRRCPRCGGRHGKPWLSGPGAELQFSVSHAGDVVGLAVTRRGPVGIDVEPLDGARVGPWLDDAALSPSERQELRASSGADPMWARALVWTRKEALLKASGYGLIVDPAQVRVSAARLPPALCGWDHAPSRPTAATLRDLDPGPQHVASLAVLAPGAFNVVEHKVHPVPTVGSGVATGTK